MILLLEFLAEVFYFPRNVLVVILRTSAKNSRFKFHGTVGEQKDLERVQKVALKIILSDDYSSYQKALQLTGLDTLTAIRTKLC